MRLTYLVDDLEPDGGGTAFFPGSHRAAAITDPDRALAVNPIAAGGGVGANYADLASAVAPWLNRAPLGGDLSAEAAELPHLPPGAWPAHGAAGSCVVNCARATDLPLSAPDPRDCCCRHDVLAYPNPEPQHQAAPHHLDRLQTSIRASAGPVPFHPSG